MIQYIIHAPFQLFPSYKFFHIPSAMAPNKWLCNNSSVKIHAQIFNPLAIAANSEVIYFVVVDWLPILCFAILFILQIFLPTISIHNILAKWFDFFLHYLFRPYSDNKSTYHHNFLFFQTLFPTARWGKSVDFQVIFSNKWKFSVLHSRCIAYCWTR